MELTAGARLGRYELLAPLGEGAMGAVWEALLHGPAGFRKPVALKLLRGEPGGQSTSNRNALLREARLGALVCHPNVVGTWELGQSGTRWFVAMELVRGVSLAQLVVRGPLPVTAVLDVGRQVCAGLAHIHGLEVEGELRALIHRDLKPSNLLVDRIGVVKIADLGVSRLEGTRSLGDVSGTRGYMAPEQLAGRPVPASDVYALGLVLAHLVTGVPPLGVGEASVDGDEAATRLQQHVLPAVERLCPELAPILASCLMSDPADRTPASGVAAALSAVVPPPGPALAALVEERLAGRPALSAAVPAERASAATFDPGVVGWALPEPHTPLVGRDGELVEVEEALAAHSSVVLVGPPGVGKTRLALELAHRSGAAWVDCRDAHGPLELGEAVALAIGGLAVGEDPTGQVARVLTASGVQHLVLDNVEQLGASADDVVERWLAEVPHLKVLRTTRTERPLAGERVVRVPPLALDDAVSLFRRLAEPGPDEDELDDVRELVERVVRLPLAVELLAARAALLTPRQMLDRLQQRFELLAQRGGPQQPGSLFAALEASVALLSPQEREAYAQLSVFAGGFDLEAAEAVLSLGPDAPWAVDVVSTLVTHSLVQLDRPRQRFTMLVSVQEHAATRLVGDLRRRTEQRHLEYAVRLADPRGWRFSSWNREHENLAVALERALRIPDEEAAATLCVTLCRVLLQRGPLPLAIELCTRTLAIATEPVHRARLLATRASAHRERGAYGIAEQDLASAREALGEIREPDLRVWMAAHEGAVARESGRLAQALEILERVRHTPEASPRTLTMVHSELGAVLRQLGRLAEAEACHRQALAYGRAVGHPGQIATSLNNLALVTRARDSLEGIGLLEEAVEVAERAGLAAAQEVPLHNLAGRLVDVGRLQDAEQAYQRALRANRAVANPLRGMIVRAGLAELLMKQGRLDEARELLARVSDALALLPVGPWHSVEPQLEAQLAGVEGRRADQIRLLEVAVALEREHGEHEHVLALSAMLAETHLRAGAPEIALEIADTLQEEGSKYEPIAGLLGLVRGQAWLALDDHDRAEAALWTTLELVQPELVARARAGLARCAARAGRLRAAEALVTEAALALPEVAQQPHTALAAELSAARAEIDLRRSEAAASEGSNP